MGPAYIYLDIVFLINLIMDYAILWATARLGQIPVSQKRLLAGALVGAFYCVALLLPGLNFLYSLLFRLFLSLVIIAVAFAPLSPFKFLQACGYFYLIAFTMGGAMLGGVYLLSTNPEFFSILNRLGYRLLNISSIWLLLGLAMAVVIGKWGTFFVRRVLGKDYFQVPLTICLGGKDLTVSALLDTGNQLKDPLTQVPVIIAEYRAVEAFLPEDLKNLFAHSQELDLKQMAEEMANSAWSSRFRLIPFSSIGKKHGMLLGLRPDEISFEVNAQKIKTRKVILGIYDKPLCPKGSYQALLHPDLLSVVSA